MTAISTGPIPTAAIPTGVGTGVGSMPGADAAEAAAIVNGELDLAFVAEQPTRGIGADLIGRMAAILIDLPMDAGTWGYRLSGRPSSVTRRATDLLRTDLDAVEELWDRAGFIGTGRTIKVQACGPYTFAATAELGTGHRVIRDSGAVRDVLGSTAEGVRALADSVAARLGAEVIVQLDEPMIGAVLDGTVPSLTRYDPILPRPVADVANALAEVVSAIDRPVLIHDCAAPRWDLVSRLPGVGWSLDLSQPRTADLDGIGMLLDRGDVLAAGVVPATAEAGRILAAAEAGEKAAAELARLIDRIGLSRKVLRDNVLVTPTCGLSGASSAHATAALGAAARAGSLLADDPEAL